MLYEIPDRMIDRTPKSVPMPSSSGHLLTKPFSDWFLCHRDHARLLDMEGVLHIEISDAVTVMSFLALAPTP